MLTVRTNIRILVETSAKPIGSNRKCKSTIRDECNGVELEISTNPKQGGYRKIEDIVSADGDIG